MTGKPQTDVSLMIRAGDTLGSLDRILLKKKCFVFHSNDAVLKKKTQNFFFLLAIFSPTMILQDFFSF